MTQKFEDKNRRNAGIRLRYDVFFLSVPGIKDGILLELGFAKITPNENVHISLWMYDKAIGVELKMTDNRAMGIACYHPGYTLVEKFQTIVTKFRVEQGADSCGPKVNFMRQMSTGFCSKMIFRSLSQHRRIWIINSIGFQKQILMYHYPRRRYSCSPILNPLRYRYENHKVQKAIHLIIPNLLSTNYPETFYKDFLPEKLNTIVD